MRIFKVQAYIAIIACSEKHTSKDVSRASSLNGFIRFVTHVSGVLGARTQIHVAPQYRVSVQRDVGDYPGALCATDMSSNAKTDTALAHMRLCRALHVCCWCPMGGWMVPVPIMVLVGIYTIIHTSYIHTTGPTADMIMHAHTVYHRIDRVHTTTIYA